MRLYNYFALCLFLLVAAGCNKDNSRLFVPDPKFSYNLVEVPSDWPDEKKDWPKDPDEALVEQQIYERYGTPDYFRLMWFRDDRLAASGDIKQMALGKSGKKLKRHLGSQEREWIYLDQDKAIRFKRGEAIINPVTDQIRTIADYGDPHAIRDSTDIAGYKTKSFQYYDTGKIFYFREGKKIREEQTTAVPGMTIRN